jgi:hypothetical protein
MPVQAQDKPAAEKAGGKTKKEATEKAAPATPEAAKPDASKAAAPKADKNDRAGRAIPFGGKLDSKTATSITVGTRTFEVTSETKFVKAGKEEATLADGEVGQQVGGQYVKDGEKLVAKTIRFGPKAGAAEGDKKPKADKKTEKAAEREAKKAAKPSK